MPSNRYPNDTPEAKAARLARASVGRPVRVFGVEYSSIRKAAAALNRDIKSIKQRIKRGTGAEFIKEI